MTQVLAYAPQLPPSSLLALHSASQAEVSQTAQRTNVLSFSRIRPQLMSASPRASTPRHSHPSSPSGVIISERNGETGTTVDQKRHIKTLEERSTDSHMSPKARSEGDDQQTQNGQKRVRSSSSCRSSSPDASAADNVESPRGETKQKKRRRVGPRPAYTKAQTTMLYRAHTGGLLRKPGGYEFVAFLTGLKREQVQKWKYNLPSRKRITPLIASLQSESLAFAQRMVLAAARQKGLTNLKVMAEFCTLTNVQVADWFIDCAREESSSNSNDVAEHSAQDHAPSRHSRQKFLEDVRAVIFEKQQEESRAARCVGNRRKSKRTSQIPSNPSPRQIYATSTTSTSLSRSETPESKPSNVPEATPQTIVSSRPKRKRTRSSRCTPMLDADEGAVPTGTRLNLESSGVLEPEEGTGESEEGVVDSEPRERREEVAEELPSPDERRKIAAYRAKKRRLSDPSGLGPTHAARATALGDFPAFRQPTRTGGTRTGDSTFGHIDHGLLYAAYRQKYGVSPLDCLRESPRAQARLFRSPRAATARTSHFTGVVDDGRYEYTRWASSNSSRSPRPRSSRRTADAFSDAPPCRMSSDGSKTFFNWDQIKPPACPPPCSSSPCNMSRSVSSRTPAPFDCDKLVSSRPPATHACDRLTSRCSPAALAISRSPAARDHDGLVSRRSPPTTPVCDGLVNSCTSSPSDSSRRNRGGPRRTSLLDLATETVRASERRHSSSSRDRCSTPHVHSPSSPTPIVVRSHNNPMSAGGLGFSESIRTRGCSVRQTSRRTAQMSSSPSSMPKCPCGHGHAANDDLCRCSKCARWFHRMCLGLSRRVAHERRHSLVCAGCAFSS